MEEHCAVKLMCKQHSEILKISYKLHKAHDTRSRNRRHKSTPFFWHRLLHGIRVSCKSRIGFFWYQIQAPIRTLFYSKPESGVHVTEMMTCDWFMITVDLLMCREVVLCSAIICLFIWYFIGADFRKFQWVQAPIPSISSFLSPLLSFPSLPFPLSSSLLFIPLLLCSLLSLKVGPSK